MNQLIDIGVNLTHKSLQQDLEVVMSRAHQAGVEQMVVIGASLEDSHEAIELCRRYPHRLVSTCGIHPHHASDWGETSYAGLEALARHECVRAIGETGLDFNRNFSPAEAQENAFRRQMELAIALQKPLFCHQRDAHQRFVALLAEYRDRLGAVLIHCFTDSREALLEYLELDCYIGISGWICDERRGLDLQQSVSLIPDDRLLLETDAPYLLPRNFVPRPASRINEPAYLTRILEMVAIHQHKSLDLLASQCLQNSRRFFDL